MVLESQLDHSLTLVAGFPVAVVGPVGHLHVLAVEYLVHRIVGAHGEFALGVGVTIVVEHGLGIVQVELSKTHQHPGMLRFGGIVGRYVHVRVAVFLQVVTRLRGIGQR